jgi:AraC family transcriptional regulator
MWGLEHLGKIATKTLASGNGWTVCDAICTSGPRDRPYEEQHGSFMIAAVVEGTFRYRAGRDSEVLSPGALLLGNDGRYFECGHEHATGDRCVSFHYTPEFFDRAGAMGTFPVHSIPPMAALTPWLVEARLAVQSPEKVAFEELAHGLVGAVLGILGKNGEVSRATTAADERRISATLRFIEANLAEPLPLAQLASGARMSEFHFLRVFRQVTHVTPHQYILRARLREAALRLKTTTADVLEIALASGFLDLSNFHHSFRAEFGASPRAYRQQGRLQTRGAA